MQYSLKQIMVTLKNIRCYFYLLLIFIEIPYDDIPLLTRTLNFASNNIRHIKPFKKNYIHLTELRLDDNLIEAIEKNVSYYCGISVII